MNPLLDALFGGLEPNSYSIEARVFARGGGAPFIYWADLPTDLGDRLHNAGTVDRRDVYFGVAPRRPGATTGRKESILGATALWADLDAGIEGHRRPSAFLSTEEALVHLKTASPLRPSAVIHSGNGIHAYWFLDRLYTDTEAIEAALRAVGKAVRGDAVWDLPRILRLPGTSNHKTSPCRPCEILEIDPACRYSLDEARAAFGKTKAEAVAPDLIKVIKEGGLQIGSRSYPSRSERDFAVVRRLVADGVEASVIKSLFRDKDNQVGERFREEVKRRGAAAGDLYLDRMLTKVARNPDLPKSEIVVREDGYWTIGPEGDIDRRLSNFTLDFKSRTLMDRAFGETDIVRTFDILLGGKPHEVISIPASVLVDPQRFAAALAAKGPFFWLGTALHLRCLMITLTKNEASRPINRRLLMTGFVGDERLWLFSNGFVDATGQWVEQQSTNPRQIEIIPLDSGTAGAPVNLCPPASNESVTRAIDLLVANVGPGAALALGWFAALPYLPDIERAIVPCQFPILFLFGRSKAGKSVLAHWLLRTYGITEGTDAGNTTPANLQRRLAYFSCLPVFLNEFQNTQQMKTLETLLLNAYDRTGVAKAERDTSQVRSLPVRAALMLAGEHLPERPSLANRCLTIRLQADQRDDSLRDEIERLVPELPALGARWISERQRTGGGIFLCAIKRCQADAVEAGADQRFAFNVSVALAGLMPWIETNTRLKEAVWDYAFALVKGSRSDESETSYLTEFVRDVAQLRILTESDDRISRILRAGLTCRTDESYLSIPTVFPLWEESLRRRGRVPPLSQRDLRRYLLEESSWAKEERKIIDGHYLRVVTLIHATMPDDIKEIWCKA